MASLDGPRSRPLRYFILHGSSCHPHLIPPFLQIAYITVICTAFRLRTGLSIIIPNITVAVTNDTRDCFVPPIGHQMLLRALAASWASVK